MYIPDFSDPALSALLNDRGLTRRGETFLDLLRKFFDRVKDYPNMTAVEKNQAWRYLTEGRLMPATQLLVGATAPDKSVGSCTVIDFDLSQPSRTFELLEERSILGEGVGIDLTKTANPAATAQAINERLKVLSDKLRAEKQRPPALMLTCSSDHPRVEEFCRVKAGADLNDWVANISVKIESVDGLLRLMDTVSNGIHSNGEPGVLFSSEIDESNPNPEMPYVSTAPCAEAMLALDEQCVFVTVNVAAHIRDGQVDFDDFGDSCYIAALLANAVIDNAPNLSISTKYKRKIGIGLCGLHTALIYLGLEYEKSERLSSDLGEILSFRTKFASMQVAKRSNPYPGFSASRWNEPRWRENKFRAKAGRIPVFEWIELMSQITLNGLANASTVCFPPTGVSSDILGVSKSYEPHFALNNRQGIASTRQEKVPAEVTWANDAGVSESVLKTALQISPQNHLRIHRAFSKWSDDSGSKTVNLPESTTPGDISRLLLDSWDAGVKGLTMFREGCIDA